MPRRDYDDDDFDDRPRPRTRRQYEDDDEEYDPRPRRRQGSSGSNVAIIIIAVVIGGVVLLGLAGVGAYFALRSKPVAGPVAVNNPGPPPVIAPPPVIGAPAAPVIPGMPGMPGPGIPAAGNQATISNLRIQRGLGGRNELVFEYNFPGGRPVGIYSAVVTQPGGQPATATLTITDQQGTISLRPFGPFGANFPSGTTVYLAKHAGGIRNVPPAISNSLTLP
jgi:hypothetical protein